jgi:hypothetical protein
MSDRLKKLTERFSKWKYVLLVAAAGLLLMLWPSGTARIGSNTAAEKETRVEEVLSQIEGVGEVQVLLSEEGAAVVCQGADDASVRLAVMEAVRCYTGLMSTEITVFKMR